MSDARDDLILKLEQENARLAKSVEELRRNEERWRAIFFTEPECVKTLDANGCVIDMNPAGLRIIEADSLEQIKGCCVFPLAQGEHRANFQRLTENVFRGQSGVLAFEITGLKGRKRWLETHAAPFRDDQGRVIAEIAVTRDITERRQLEDQFRQAQKMEAVGQLAGGVAHDFNNILAAIMMQADLAGEAVAPEIRDRLHQIRGYAERAANLTRQLLLLSRRQVMEPLDLDLNEIVTDLSRMLRRIIGDNIALHLNLHGAPLMIRADAGMLDQVLLNLAVNARDAMPLGGRLTIETSETKLDAETASETPEAAPGRHVCLTVSDTGSGIPPEVLPHIFEPFFTTKEPGKGTGLGLATVFGVIKQHRGFVKVLSPPHQGATFHVCLPASSAIAPIHAIRQPQPLRSAGGTETILLVEDESAVRLLSGAVLERAGYRVLCAANGLEALRLWEENHGKVHLLLTDIMMPEGLSGFELADTLQSRQPRLRALFTSGYSGEHAGRERTLREGQNFLQKPAAIHHLLQTVRRVLDN